MKKILIYLLVLITSFSLTGCEKQEEKIDYNELTNLKYYEYLNDNNPLVTIKVEGFGTMQAELFTDVAPNTVNNFISYIEEEAFNGSSFHRIIENFMIQGGIVNNTKNSIKGEFTSNGFENNLKHYPGVLSMARTNNPNSATSQFFIMHKNSPHLDGAYASFGGLVSGFDVLNEIATTETYFNDGPIEKVVIESITINLRGYNPSDVIYN